MRTWKSWARILLIGIALVVICSNTVPVMAGGLPANWTNIDPALKSAMTTNPNGTYSVIVELGHPNKKTPTAGLKRAAEALDHIKNAGGKGMGDAYAAVTSNASGKDNAGLRPSDAFCVNVYCMIKGAQPLVWKDPNYAGIDWSNLSWDNLSWDNLAWDNLSWDNLSWDNLSWGNLSWGNLSWDSSGNWDSTQSSVDWQSATTLD